MTTLLSDLPNGIPATVAGVCANGLDLDADQLRRLGELGFLPGEPVQVLRRGPGGREPHHSTRHYLIQSCLTKYWRY